MIRFGQKIVRCFRSRCQLPIRPDQAILHEGMYFCCQNCLEMWTLREANSKADFRPYRSVSDEFTRASSRDYMD